MPLGHLVDPPLSCSATREPVGKDSVAGPHVANVEGAIGIQHERIRLVPIIEGSISVASVLGVWDINGRVDDGDVMLPIGGEVRNQGSTLVVSESDWVVLEIWDPSVASLPGISNLHTSILIHIINVCPDMLQGNLEFGKVGYDVRHL